MNVLVTGATGLIGAHLTAKLNAAGHTVAAVTRGAIPDRPVRDLQWYSLDLAAPSWNALPTGVDVIVHLAQSPHYRSFPEGAMDVFNVNVASTARLLDWAREVGVKQFILASSGGVSDVAVPPLSHYVVSKRCAELLAESYAAFFHVLILRFFFVYGTGQKPWMLVPRLVRSVASGGEITLAGTDGPRLNPVYVGDAVDAIARGIAGQASGTIDIAGPEVLTVRAMGEAIAARLRRRANYASDPGAVPRDLIGDISLMSSRLAPPRYRFTEGIAEWLPDAGMQAN